MVAVEESKEAGEGLEPSASGKWAIHSTHR